MAITSIPHLGPVAAHREKKTPSCHLPGICRPSPSPASPCRDSRGEGFTLICRRRSPPPPPLSLHLLSPSRTAAWAQRASPPREKPPSPRSSSSQVPSPLLPAPAPPHPSSERSGVSDRGDLTASRAHRGVKPQTWHRRPSAQTAISTLWRPGPTQTQPRASVEWFDKHGIVVRLRPRKHSNGHIYHGRVIARGLTYRGGVGLDGDIPSGERSGPARLVQRHRRSGDRGRCRLRAGHHDARARLALNRRRGRGGDAGEGKGKHH